MTPQESSAPTLNLEELLGFREQTERISDFLFKRLKDHLAALSPLLTPSRVLGKHSGARESASRADEALALLTERYQQVCGTLSFLKPEIDEETLAAISPTIEVNPYEYTHEAQGAKGARNISMTSPVQWVATYASGYSLSQIRNLVTGGGDRRAQPVRQFVVNALAFQVVLARSAGASLLMKDLRYQVDVQSLPGLEGIPLTVVSIQLPSFRPPDDLLLTAIRLSGVAAFHELIHPDAVHSLQDPLRAEIRTLSEESAL